MSVAPNIAVLYDFSVIETAVQSLAAATNDTIWLTGFNAAQLQKSRPRVECYLENVTIFGDPPHYQLVNPGAQRLVNGWRGSLRTVVITPIVPGEGVDPAAIELSAAQQSYTLHWQYRSFVASLMATIDQQLKSSDSFLPYHEIARCWEAGSISKIAPQEGTYTSTMNHNLVFNIRSTAWPGGLAQK